MRHSVWFSTALAFLLGGLIDNVLFKPVQYTFFTEVVLVATSLLVFILLCSILYYRHISQCNLLIENQLEYLSAQVDGLPLMKRLAKRCSALQRMRLQANDELVIHKKQLYEANELIKLILDQITVATLLVDQRGVVLAMNQRAEFVTGYQLNDLKGRPLNKLALIDGLSSLCESGWSQQLASTTTDFGLLQSSALMRRNGDQLKCKWRLEELSLPIHRYYLIRIYSDM